MSTHPVEPIRYDAGALLGGNVGLSEDDYRGLADRLEGARRAVLNDLDRFNSGDTDADETEMPDARFIDLPDRLLADYHRDREQSELGRILRVARELAEQVDRVVVLGIGGSYMGARALMDACCHPYHNELERAARGGIPRLYFEGNNVDNDSTAGLLELLAAGDPQTIAGRWAIVPISKSGGTLETAVALRQFYRALTTIDADAAASRMVPVTGPSGKLFDLSQAIGAPDPFTIPEGVGGRFSIFTAVGLLPAAILGLDVVKLLEGAAAMTKHFREAPPDENIVMRFVGGAHLAEEKLDANIRVLSVWSKGLEAVGLWYDQLLAESLGKECRGATPITVVNTRDLHSRGQQHQEGKKDKLITNLIVDHSRCDPQPVGKSPFNQDGLNELANQTLPDIMDAALRGTNQAYADVQRPTADLHLPRTDESSLGQLFQMLMLATVAEGRLIGINPYGQPGVEAYKTNMNALLREKVLQT